jgi:hypothetical protein
MPGSRIVSVKLTIRCPLEPWSSEFQRCLFPSFPHEHDTLALIKLLNTSPSPLHTIYNQRQHDAKLPYPLVRLSQSKLCRLSSSYYSCTCLLYSNEICQDYPHCILNRSELRELQQPCPSCIHKSWGPESSVILPGISGELTASTQEELTARVHHKYLELEVEAAKLRFLEGQASKHDRIIRQELERLSFVSRLYLDAFVPASEQIQARKGFLQAVAQGLNAALEHDFPEDFVQKYELIPEALGVEIIIEIFLFLPEWEGIELLLFQALKNSMPNSGTNPTIKQLALDELLSGEKDCFICTRRYGADCEPV